MSHTEHKTYKDRFSDTTQNPFGSGLAERKLGYGDYNNTWRCENHPIPNDEGMMLDAVTSQHIYCTGATVTFTRELDDDDAHLHSAAVLLQLYESMQVDNLPRNNII